MIDQIMLCDLHDYLEIACMYEIEVEITLKDGACHQGVPITTQTKKNEGEYLQFYTLCGRDLLVPLLLLKSMRATSSNPHFDKVMFSDQ